MNSTAARTKCTIAALVLGCVAHGCAPAPAPAPARVAANAPAAMAGAAASPTPLGRFVVGIDPEPIELETEEIARELNDPWATLVLRPGHRPLSLDQVLENTSSFEAGPPPFERSSFVVGEGSQIPLDASEPSKTLDRGFRLLVTWERGQDELIFLGAPAGSRQGFLEVISWDARKRAFNYYERSTRQEQWVWRGDTSHAFDARSRGQGCFACHPNGTLMMKELNRPWINWATEEAPISAQAVPPHVRPPDLPRVRALFDQHAFAMRFEPKIKSGIGRTNDARVTAQDGRVRGARALFRQLMDSRNVNLISSETKAVSATDRVFMRVPLTFFVNEKAFNVLQVPLAPVNTSVQWKRYREAIGPSGFQLALVAGPFRRPGDTHFAFLVPEPAFEDVDLLKRMVDRGLVAPKLAAALLMVDFPNSVYSPRRNHLLRYLEALQDTVAEDARAGLSAQLAESIRAAAATQPACAPAEDPSRCTVEQEFVRLWDTPDESWRARFGAQIQDYLGKVSAALQTAEGLDQIIRLSISRRRDFREHPPGFDLAESLLLFPQAAITASLQMTRSGVVTTRTGSISSAETRNP